MKDWTLGQWLWAVFVIPPAFVFVVIPWIVIHQLVRIPYLIIYDLLVVYGKDEAAYTLRKKFRVLESRFGVKDY